MSSNEVRQKIGMKPSDDPGADELRNKNLSKPNEDNNSSMDMGNLEKIKQQIKEENQNGSKV